MRLITQRQAEAIGEAYMRMPPGVAARLRHVEVFEGDPFWAGLANYGEATDDGRSYRQSAHFCEPRHISGPADRRVSTIVLPCFVEPDVVVHELGHALHEVLDWELTPEPVTAYAETNRWEAFAEAFACWVCPVEYHNVQDYLYSDEQTIALFRSLI